jgi:hypothetical protein
MAHRPSPFGTGNPLVTSFMTKNSNPTSVSFSVQIRVDITGPAEKPKAKGKAFLKFLVLSLLVFAASVFFGTAATASDFLSLELVKTVWQEIKPVLVLLLQVLLK